jgi:hypothetical protein
VAAEELARPGVEVIQEFRTVTPTVITPTLVPSVVGVAKQIVEVLVDDGAGGNQLNPDALIVLPALAISKPGTGNPIRYTGIGTAPNNQLKLSVNESPVFTIAFSDPTAFGLTPATVVDQINKQLADQLITSVVAETVGDDRWQLRTVGAGDFESILVDDTTTQVVADTFGFGLGKTYRGISQYQQYEVEIPPTALPDPNDNLDELAVEQDSIRVFFFTGSGVGLQEALRTQSFLSRGEVADAAVTTEGTVDLSTNFPFFSGEVLWLQLDVGDLQVVSIPATINDSASLLALLNGTSGFTGVTASLGTGTPNGLVFTRNEGGYDKTIEILTPDSNSANGLLGLTAQEVNGTSIKTVDDGNGDAVTPLVEFSGVNFDASPGNAVLSGSGAANLPPPANSTLVISDGGPAQTITFDGTEAFADIKTAIENVLGANAGGTLTVTESTGPTPPAGAIIITNSRFGEESVVNIIGGTALPYLDLGDTPAVTTEGSTDLSPDTPAVTTEGTVNLADGAGFPTLGAETFTINLNGGGAATVTLAGESDFATLKANIEGAVPGILATRASGTTGGLVLTDNSGPPYGSASTIVVADLVGGLAVLGLIAESVAGQDIFTAYDTAVGAGVTFQAAIDGAAPITVTLDGTQANFAAVAAVIDAALSVTTSTQGVNGGVVMTGTATGVAATIELIDDGGGGIAALGLTVGTYAGDGENIVAGAKEYGAPFKAEPGDELWLDGLFYATISKVSPGGLTDTLRIDRQVPIEENIGRYWYIVAKNLTPGAATIGVSRPTQDFILDAQGTLIIKHDQLRDIEGAPVPGKVPLYIAYSAVRQDVTALATNPGLLRFDSTIQLEQQLPPINTDNPLSLGLFYALVNAPGVQITGLGVDAISADAPFGTVEAFTRAAEYLEGFEVYALAPLTHDSTVGQVFNTHVNFMSEPESKGERIVLWNPEVPERALDTLVASGTDGDGLTTTTFDTKVVNLSTLLTNAGINPVGTIPTTDGVFLDIASDDKHYSIESISGGVVTIRTTLAAGTNEDGFYSTDPLELPLISEAFAVRVRGAELLTPTGQKDKPAIATTMADLARSYGNRRFWLTFPDQAAATVEGLEQLINGFYMNAAIVGMIGQQPPQQSFTNYPMSGFTRVVGSNDTFSDRQLNQMAAGGVYIIVQDTEGGPLTSRMALTTDMTSIETRTDSITKVVDFTAKFMRRGLRNFIGRFNITQGFLDTLGSVIQGMGGFLVETGVLIGLTLNNIIQDEDARDTVLIDTTLDPPYPCNYIRLTLVV